MDNQLPSADDQIMARLQNAVRGVLLELESQGTATESVSGAYSIVVVSGVVSISGPSYAQPDEVKSPVDSVRAGKIKPAADAPVTAE